MIEQNIYEKLTTEELRQLAKEMVDRMSTKERDNLLKWIKKEFPRLDKAAEQLRILT